MSQNRNGVEPDLDRFQRHGFLFLWMRDYCCRHFWGWIQKQSVLIAQLKIQNTQFQNIHCSPTNSFVVLRILYINDHTFTWLHFLCHQLPSVKNKPSGIQRFCFQEGQEPFWCSKFSVNETFDKVRSLRFVSILVDSLVSQALQEIYTHHQMINWFLKDLVLH